MGVYRVFFVKEVLVDADSFEDAVERAIDDDYIIMCDEYLDDERNTTDGGREDGDE